MSRIGKKPIEIPQGVTVAIQGNQIKVKGAKGELTRVFPKEVKVEQKDTALIVTRTGESDRERAIHGLFRSLIANMVEGVTKGYEKKMEIVGVGFKFKASGNKITLNVGFSHPVEFKAVDGVTFEEDKEEKSVFTIKGIDKETVGETAAKVRAIKPPEPYKGKGIRYHGEHIEKKAGKAAATGAAGGAA